MEYKIPKRCSSEILPVAYRLKGKRRDGPHWPSDRAEKLILLVAFFAMVCAASSFAQEIELTPAERAWLDAHHEITIASYSEAAPFGFTGENGSYVGVIPDFTAKLQSLLGVEIHFQALDYSALISSVKDGAADVVTLNDPFDMPFEPHYVKSDDFLFLPYSLYVRRDSELAREMPGAVSGRTIALCRGWDLNNPALLVLNGNRFVVADTMLDCVNLVVQGKADGVFDVHSELSYILQRHSIQELTVYRMYREGYSAAFFVRKDWPELQQILDKAIRAIPQNEMGGLLKKWNAYFDEDSYRIALVRFSPEERQWIREHPVVRIGIDANRPPIEYDDFRGGHSGLTVDYLKRIEKILGIEFDKTSSRTLQGVLRKAEDREVDAVSGIAETPERAAYLTFTKPFVTLPVALITRDTAGNEISLDALAHKRVAIGREHAAGGWLKRDFPEIELVATDSSEESIRLLAEGKVDGCVDAMLTASHAIAKLGLTHLRVSTDTPYSYNLCIATRSDWPLFGSLLQKALDTIPETERAELLAKWAPVTYQRGFDYSLLWKWGAIALGLLAFFVYWNRRLARLVEERTSALEREYQTRRENDRRFHAVFNQSYQLIGIVSPNGELVAANDGAVQFLGVSKEDVLNRPFWETPWWSHDPVQQERLRAAVSEAARGDFVRFEATHQDKDGNLRYYDFSLKPVMDESGTVTMIIPEGRDITEYKRINEALRQSEEHYRFLFEQNPAPMLIYERGTLQVLAVNDAFERHYGYTRAEAREMRLVDLYPESEKQAIRELASRLHGHAYAGEWHHLKRDGTVMTIVAYSHDLIFDGYDARVAVIADITERKQAEAALADSEERYRALYEAAADAIFVMDGSSFLQCNARTMEVFGCTREQILGHSPARFSPEFQADGRRSSDKAAEFVAATLRGEAQHFEWRHLRMDGTPFDAEVSLTAVTIRGGTFILAIVRDISDRKQAEQRLREQDQMIRSIVETSQDWIWTMDLNGMHTYSNPAVTAILGYEPDEILRKSYQEGMRDDDCREVAQLLADCIATRSGWRNLLIRWRHKDGSWRDLESSAVPIVDEAGRMTGFRGVDRDVTERRRSQVELEQEKRFTDVVIESMPSMLFVFDLNLESLADSKLVRINTAKPGSLGYARAEQEAMTLGQWFDTSEWSHISGLAKQLLRDGSMRMQLDLRAKNGALIPHDCYARFIDLNGRPHMVGSALDVSAYVRTMRMLREREAELKRAQEVGRVGSWHYHVHTGEFSCSDETYRILQVKRDDPGAESLVRSMLRTGQTELIRAQIAAGRRGEQIDAEKQIALNGKSIWVRLRSEVEFDATGAAAGIVGTVQDITESVEIDRQLRQAQKMEAIGTLAGGIAHDFNNILGAITGYSELLRDMANNSEEPDWTFLEQILLAAERAKDLVRQILTFSRQTEQERRPLRVSPIVKEALKLLRGALPSSIQIQQSIGLDTDTIVGDPTQIHQIVMNLCTNAFHAMKEGGTLSVRLESMNLDEQSCSHFGNVQPGAYVCLTVSDTGCGIPEENLARIFDPFFTTKARGEGTGLGLAVVHGIANSHGGGIAVRSAVGAGTTFEVLFPQVEIQEEREEISERPLPRGSERVLVVDDEEPLLRIAAIMLTSLGYEVVTRRDGAEAHELVMMQGREFDIVITDLTMPRMKGSELAMLLRETFPNLPILLCTGYSEREDTEDAYRQHFNGLLRKPVSKRELAFAVRAALDRGCVQ